MRHKECSRRAKEERHYGAATYIKVFGFMLATRL